MIHVDLVGTARILQALLPLAEPGTVAVCWASNSAHMGATPAGDPVLDGILDDPLAADLRDAPRRRARRSVGHPGREAARRTDGPSAA